jgi:hypothetical protein
MTKTSKSKRQGVLQAALSATIAIPIPVEALPPLVPRQLAARFMQQHPRTLARAEGNGLTPIRRNRRVVLYEKGELLRYYGLAQA